eukprot:NODE_15592_length_225_cov_0.835294.p2 GENE.NODE_15592_length_225_cov_0.835294~~NODE_15592_length_225_cov_0.835294.p2  ORF type:complete len:59 (-),score=11.80 NODE_15592_length_225_cov_0.835294:24-200(-)
MRTRSRIVTTRPRKLNEKLEDLQGCVDKLSAKSDQQAARTSTLKGEGAALLRALAHIA